MTEVPSTIRSRATLSSRSRKRTVAVLAALVVLAAAPVRAQVSCKLIQPDEVGSTLKEWAGGGKPGEFAGSSAKSGDIDLDTCHVEIVRKGQGNLQISVVVARNLPMSGTDAIRSRNIGLARESQWKVKGAQFDEKTVGKAMCTRYGRPGVPAHAVCAIPGATGYVEVDVIAPSQSEVPSMDAVATLVQKASSRLR